jgi:Flp pilus assembly protein TadB
MTLLGQLLFLLAAIAVVFFHAPLDIAIIALLAVIILSRWLLGERIPRRPA